MNGPAPSGGVAPTGSTFSQMPKIMIRNTPETNSGRPSSDSPNTLIVRSAQPPDLSAAITPERIASGTQIRNATSASLSEFTRAVVMNGLIGSW